jgi:outer membrane protein assembly factor BamB
MQFIKIYSVALVFAISAQIVVAQDWPQWRGPNRDGALNTFAAPEVWPEKLKQVWKAPVGLGHSSPLVVAGKIYQHARQDDDEVVLCLDLNTGKTLWRQNYPAPYSMNFAAYGHGKGPKSTPVFHSGKLYTLGISGILSCFDAATGNLKWRKEFSKQFKQTSPAFGVSMSPVIDNALCIVHAGGPNQGALIAFDAETGAVKWSWQGDGPGHASPIVAELAGTRQVITQTQNFCIGVAAATGQLLWKIPFTTDYDQNIVTPIIYQNLIIFSGLDKGTFAIKVNKSGTNWATEQIWHNKELSMYMNSPVLSGSLLFGMSDRRSGQYFCLDAKTGATLWTSEGRQGDYAAMIVAGDFLFLLNDEANLIVAKAAAKAYEPVGKYTVAESETWAHPAVIGKQILVKDKSALALWSLE